MGKRGGCTVRNCICEKERGHVEMREGEAVTVRMGCGIEREGAHC